MTDVVVRIRYNYFWGGFDPTITSLNFIFSNFKYIIVDDDSYDILVLSVFHRDKELINIKPNSLVILFVGESEIFVNTFLQETSIIPHILFGFPVKNAKLNNTIQIFYPLWILENYDLVTNRELLDEINNKNRNIRNKKALLVCSHDREGQRTLISDIVNKKFSVDYGGDFRNNIPKIPDGYDKKLEILERYTFNICPENHFQEYYNTEKLLHACLAGCIPIYSGYLGEIERLFFNIERIIYLGDLSADCQYALSEYLENLSDQMIINEINKPIFRTENISYLIQHRNNVIDFFNKQIQTLLKSN